LGVFFPHHKKPPPSRPSCPPPRGLLGGGGGGGSRWGKTEGVCIITWSIYLLQYRGVIACWCMTTCMPTPTARQIRNTPRSLAMHFFLDCIVFCCIEQPAAVCGTARPQCTCVKSLAGPYTLHTPSRNYTLATAELSRATPEAPAASSYPRPTVCNQHLLFGVGSKTLASRFRLLAPWAETFPLLVLLLTLSCELCARVRLCIFASRECMAFTVRTRSALAELEVGHIWLVLAFVHTTTCGVCSKIKQQSCRARPPTVKQRPQKN